MTLLPNRNEEPLPITKPAIVFYIRNHLGVRIMEANKFYQQDPDTWFVRFQKAYAEKGGTASICGVADKELKIRAAIQEYYKALDEHKHGGIAAQKALDKIQEILGMSWVQGATLPKSPLNNLCSEILLKDEVQPCVLDPETFFPKPA